MSEVASQVSGQRITVFHPSFYHLPNVEWGFPVAQLIKNSPAMQETLVRFLGWEDPLEKGYTAHSSILDKILVSFTFVLFENTTVPLVVLMGKLSFR